MFKWIKGRKDTGYSKMLLLHFKYPVIFDCYLLRFPKGSLIAEHTDIVQGSKHYRMNIILWNAYEGGQFYCEKLIFDSRRIKIFRPDIRRHSVSQIKKGIRYVLSIGWIRK